MKKSREGAALTWRLAGFKKRALPASEALDLNNSQNAAPRAKLDCLETKRARKKHRGCRLGRANERR